MKNAMWMPGDPQEVRERTLLTRLNNLKRQRNQITVNAVYDGIDTLEMKDLEDIKNIVDKRIRVLSIDPKELEENKIMW